eukprot:Blabericola_migrator_1__12486@NODE_78_length_15130_cov_126_174401_g70_i0_p7_GENE_NODE_78_length_15130_cov_126_174401_g70_i0NODE_78_length_15130_cov_126_174401_g70_i0_p7_ORF_typecomplete_len296_score19_50Thioesterase/PF00975_20/1_8e15Hydrolase_4/PF12146_8/4_7e11Abhydrolase_6/PF12697_7/3_3e09Abhydrolase_1/PF00561_20/9_9e06DUF1057/PF06342_12/7_6e05DUF1057/PF06342_12/5_1e02DUF900/PF05990_12/0_00016Ser_hydrolase/PF06821_13/0_0034Ser_hydrolase/PF06821_13/7_8e02Abhydrolase_2/PF02230_16/0_96Abhydrolase_
MVALDRCWFGSTNVDGLHSGIVICFHGAGGDSTMFTAKFIDRQPCANGLVEYCKSHDLLLVTPTLPGRSYNHAESMSGHCIQSLVKIIYDKVSTNVSMEADDFPVYVLAHSMGCLLAFEFMRMMIRRTGRAPKLMCLCSSVAPDTPKEDRPWRPATAMSDEELRLSMTQWDMKPEGLEPRMWAVFGKIIRADMELLDRYDLSDDPGVPVKAPCTRNMTLLLMTGSDDKVIKESHLRAWTRCLPLVSDVQICLIPKGTHRLFYEIHSRNSCYERFVACLQKLIENNGDDEGFGFGF